MMNSECSEKNESANKRNLEKRTRKMKKRLLIAISLGLAAVLCCGLLAGCGARGTDEKTIRIGASPSPHAEILNQVKAEVEAKGYK